MKTIKRNDLVYPDLSYQIYGCAFDVFAKIGDGHHEKVYQRALAEAFKNRNISFKEQVYYSIKYNNKPVGRDFFDFLVDYRDIVEITKGNRYSKTHIDQVLNYLKINNLKLAIIVNFASDGADCKRIINLIS